jgi:hypothetical protein
MLLHEGDILPTTDLALVLEVSEDVLLQRISVSYHILASDDGEVGATTLATSGNTFSDRPSHTPKDIGPDGGGDDLGGSDGFDDLRVHGFETGEVGDLYLLVVAVEDLDIVLIAGVESIDEDVLDVDKDDMISRLGKERADEAASTDKESRSITRKVWVKERLTYYQHQSEQRSWTPST